jgi:4-amino-4-deoxy-L-arabinose transferase-like glycosyltransferase
LDTLTPTYRFWLYAAALLLLLPALLINLGLMTFIDDEGIRALVALEMKFSGNLITPTLHGEYYYNKPPLYNWLLLLFFELAGRANEFVARLPTVLCLLGFAGTIYYYSRKHFSPQYAFLNAFFYITCGRVLFWDSMLGLIDTAFSWVIFTLFMVVYHEFKREGWLRLFLLSYLLAALGFLLKGLPAVVFQGITLVAWFTWQRRFWKLFSWQHLLGGLLFVLIVGGYYALYHTYNSLENVIPVLFSESSKRTVTYFGWWATVRHLFTFPFEMVYHFLPWSLMILYFLRRDIAAVLRQNDFVVFCLVAFLSNILVYWASPEVYPRYLLMLAPLIFTAYLHLHRQHEAERTWQYRTIHGLLFAVCLAAAAGAWALPFVERLSWLPLVPAKSVGLGVALLALCYGFWRAPKLRLLMTVLTLLVFRIGFNWFVLPDRNAHDYGDECRQTSILAGREFTSQPLYVYKDTEMQITSSFYLTNEQGRILPRQQSGFDSASFYIIDPRAYPELDYEKLGDFRLRRDTLTFDIGKLKLK